MSEYTDRLRTHPHIVINQTPEKLVAALKEAAHLIASASDITGREPAISDPLLRNCVQQVRDSWECADRMDADCDDR